MQRARGRRGLAELGFLALVYVGYALSRVLADDAFPPARERAVALLEAERFVGIDLEQRLNRWFLDHDVVGMLASFQYAAAHYLVTLAVVVWLLHRAPDRYVPARRALVLATMVALAAYLAFPTAPPRFLDGWTDLMAVHSAAGWWGEAASAPQGLGWMTNQLAAFPSMHAGWALWVALAVRHAGCPPVAVALAWTHAVVTAVVVVGTGNHWVLDVVAGWALVAAAWWLVVPRSAGQPWGSSLARSMRLPAMSTTTITGDWTASMSTPPSTAKGTESPRTQPPNGPMLMRATTPTESQTSATTREKAASTRG